MQNLTQGIVQSVALWFVDHGVKVVAIVFVALLLQRFAGVFIEKSVRKLVIPSRFLRDCLKSYVFANLLSISCVMAI